MNDIANKGEDYDNKNNDEESLTVPLTTQEENNMEGDNGNKNNDDEEIFDGISYCGGRASFCFLK